MSERQVSVTDALRALDQVDATAQKCHSVPGDFRPYYRQFGLPTRYWERVSVEDFPELIPTWECLASFGRRRLAGLSEVDAARTALNLLMTGPDLDLLAGEYARAAVDGGMTPLIIEFVDLLETVDASMDFDADYLELIRRIDTVPYLCVLGVHDYQGISGRACARLERVVERIERREMPWVVHITDAGARNPFTRLHRAGDFGRQVLPMRRAAQPPPIRDAALPKEQVPKSQPSASMAPLADRVLAKIAGSKGGANLTYLERGLGASREELGPVLDALVAEGKLSKSNGRYVVA